MGCVYRLSIQDRMGSSGPYFRGMGRVREWADWVPPFSRECRPPHRRPGGTTHPCGSDKKYRVLRRGDGELSDMWLLLHGAVQIPSAGGSNPLVGLRGSRIIGIRRLTGNLYRNGRSGGFGALQAPATKLFKDLSAIVFPFESNLGPKNKVRSKIPTHFPPAS
jgi:hypothetical protein